MTHRARQTASTGATFFTEGPPYSCLFVERWQPFTRFCCSVDQKHTVCTWKKLDKQALRKTKFTASYRQSASFAGLNIPEQLGADGLIMRTGFCFITWNYRTFLTLSPTVNMSHMTIKCNKVNFLRILLNLFFHSLQNFIVNHMLTSQSYNQKNINKNSHKS